MSALTIVQLACSELGITVPDAVFASTNSQVIQLRSLMNAEGKELAGSGPTDHAWTVLQTETTFSTTAAQIQVGAIPSDFGYYLNETLWNRTTRIPGYGPATPEQWQIWQAYATIAVPNFGFRFRGGSFLIYPVPTAGQTMAYEYVSNKWAQTSVLVGIAAMTADTDTSKLDEMLIKLGVIWRFLKAKGLDYSEAFRTYQMEVGKAIARDGGRRRITIGTPGARVYSANIAEGAWPG